MSERLTTVRQHKLCRICSHYLIRSSGKNVGENCLWAKSRDTPENRVPGSNKRQPVTELHINLASTMQKTVNAVTSEVAGESRPVKPSRSVAFCSVRASRPTACFKVIPVKISCHGSTKEITTYGLLDGGSDATFCLQNLVEELGLKDMKLTSFTMTTANRQGERFGHEVRLDIESLEGDAKFQPTNVLATDCLPVTRGYVATSEDLRRWLHLSDVNLPKTGDKNVTILIGGDRLDISDKQQLNKREGKHGEPIAVQNP